MCALDTRKELHKAADNFQQTISILYLKIATLWPNKNLLLQQIVLSLDYASAVK